MLHPTISFALLLGGALTATTHAQSTVRYTHRHAWAANLGWIDARPGDGTHGASVGEFICAGFLWSPNTGWINLGDGSPANGIRYSNTTGQDSGVNHFVDGRLRGLAWSASLGWVCFEDAGNPRVIPDTGALAGLAWIPNAGWLNLDGLAISHLAPETDTDGDSLPDAWELTHAPDLTPLGPGDADADGSSDLEEYQADTQPLDPTSRFAILAMTPHPDLASTKLTWTSRPTRRYRIFTSTDLEAWHASPDEILLPATGLATDGISLHPATPRRFFRIEVLRPMSGP